MNFLDWLGLALIIFGYLGPAVYSLRRWRQGETRTHVTTPSEYKIVGVICMIAFILMIYSFFGRS